MKIRVEFLYDKIGEVTRVYIWKGQQLLDKRELPGVMSSYSKTKIRKEVLKEYGELK